MILKDLGYTQADADKAAKAPFTDTKGWVTAWANLAYEKGVTKGVTATTFGGSAKLTGDVFLTFALRGLGVAVAKTSDALAAAITAGLLPAGSTLPATFTKGDAANIMFASLSFVDPTTKVSLLDKLIAAKVVTTEKAIAAGLKAAALEVTGVSATNLRQFVVTFNVAVDTTKAETKANYTFDGADLAAGDVVKVNADGKSVTVTLAATMTNQATKKLVVEKAVGIAADYKADVNFTDTTVPFAVKAEQIAPNKIKVYFNEPVQVGAGTAFQVDNGTLSAVVGTNSATEYSIEVTLGAKITTGSHTVSINPSTSTAVKDYANYAVPSASVKFDAITDAVKPTATVTANSQTELLVEFSEPVTGFEATDIYHTTTGYTANSVTAVAGSSTQYKVAFTTNPLPTGTAVVVIKKEAVTDLFDNKFGDATTYNVAVTSDTAAPTVSKVEVDGENKIKVTYSEAVTGATVASNYVVKDAAGAAVVNKAYVNASGNPIGTITYADKVATITFAANVAKGDYLLEVKNIKDGAVNPNTITTATYAFTISDKTKPTVNSVTVVAARKLVVSFSESMAVSGTGSILDATKYTIAGEALPSAATLTAGTNNASVIIELPDSSTAIAAGVAVQVGQVADAAGNLTANLATSLTGGAATGATIVNGSVKAISRTSVTLEINKPLQNIVVDDFTVNGSAVTSAVYENKTLADGTTYGAFVTLSVADANKWATNATPQVVVVAAVDTKDTLGTAIAVNAGVNAIDKMAPAVAVFGADDKADIRAYDLVGPNNKLDTIKITYTENIFAGSVGIQTYQVEGYTVVDAAVVNNVVTLTLTEKDTADTAAAPNVKQVLAIQDNLGAGLRNDKAVEADYTASRDEIIPVLLSASIATVAGANNDVLTLVFSEPMKETVAEAAAVVADITSITTAGAARTILAATVGTLSEDGLSLAFTLTEDGTQIKTGDAFSVTYTNDNANELIDVSYVGDNEVATTTVIGSVTGAVADATAPSVTTQIAAAATFTAAGTHTLVFSEALNTASKAAVKAAVDAAYTKNGTATATSAWNGIGNALTVTYTAAANPDDLVLGAIANIAVTDLAGNTSAALDVQQ